METYAELVGQLGVKAIVGKGGMMEKTIENAAKYGYVYLQAPPGCGVTTTEGFERITGVEWLDLAMPEALWILEGVKFGPLVVSMDTHGKSIYKDIKDTAMKNIEEKYSE
jgi:fumarate hydratase subunit beta/L(+)-tartrate dehydratase beta subunit